MSSLCPDSCGVCDSTCKNSRGDKQCEQWEEEGHCVNSAAFMLKNCALSCGCGASFSGYWIGLNEKNIANQYTWSDRSEVTYTVWAPLEPNNFPGKGESCVLMDIFKGKWSDQLCEEKSLGFVCKKRKTFQQDKIDDPTSVGCPAKKKKKKERKKERKREREKKKTMKKKERKKEEEEEEEHEQEQEKVEEEEEQEEEEKQQQQQQEQEEKEEEEEKDDEVALPRDIAEYNYYSFFASACVLTVITTLQGLSSIQHCRV
ncbi:C-type mannose receptor 2 [Elysia marginata]|uniref:C-type mannose receptor 2 n=1 Tax=Elysia marginata TaxID=1093978 RepID=A0AAV4EVA9_9GAST|nr:C-type mannose receptor 2 [Elysia marginata]